MAEPRPGGKLDRNRPAPGRIVSRALSEGVVCPIGLTANLRTDATAFPSAPATWLWRKLRQVDDGECGRPSLYLATVA